MARPIILITTGRIPQAAPAGQVQKVKTGCDTDYTDAVLRAGGAPRILPCHADRDAIEASVRAADGVILSGGGDVVSLAYGEEPHDMSKGQDPVRDQMELDAIRSALDLKLPILGICRGMQILNVATGGTLIQDVPSQVPEAVKHYSHGLHSVLLHTIDIEEGSLLQRVLGTTSMAINTWHHQAVKDAGHGWRINCRARDGVAEGMEADDGRPLLAVQFHPEEVAATFPPFQALFDWLVTEAIHHRDTEAQRI